MWSDFQQEANLDDERGPLSVEPVRLHLDTHRTVVFGVGSPVVVRDEAQSPYSAVVAAIEGARIELTFTPREAPRSVSMAAIVSAAKTRVADVKTVPDFQLEAAHV